MPNFPITGVARPLSETAVTNEQVALASGWILLIIGVIILILIIFFKRKFGKSKSEQYELEEYAKSINPALVESFQNKHIQIKKALIKKGLSEKKANKCIEYIISSA